ncbi:SpoIIE family protein phosphatase, partial [Streptomyces sp. CL12]|uniref:SpoIIE family protein phosphatase n=1 Tax=Streptomyces sp. CL12 TaxID=3391744 RepID=UPI003A80A178
LGVDPRARCPVTELILEPDAILALYTDGLVERAGADIDDGIADLCRALDRAGAAAWRRDGLTLSGVADRLTAAARLTAAPCSASSAPRHERRAPVPVCDDRVTGPPSPPVMAARPPFPSAAGIPTRRSPVPVPPRFVAAGS